jgi:tetratricopeptide (TPR) repeat protein
MNNLAWAYADGGRTKEALPLFEETFKLTKAKLGPEHPDTLDYMNNLAVAYQGAGRAEEALPLFEESFKLRKAKLGLQHPDTLASMNNLAGTYRDAGRFDNALPLFEQTLKLRRAQLGSEHPDTVWSMYNLALAYQPTREFGKAEALLLEAYEVLQKKDQAAPGMQRQVIECLCRLYVSWAVAEPGTGKIQKGHEWQKRLAELDQAFPQKAPPGAPGGGNQPR